MPLILVPPYKKSAIAQAVLALFDNYFDYNNLVVDFEGADGATTFVDAIGSPLTRTGTATISSARSKFGTTSARLPPNSSVVASLSNDFNISTGDFTVEGWFWYEGAITTAASQISIFSFNGTGGYTALYTWGSNKTMLLYNSSTSSYAISQVANLLPNKWTHFALQRAGSTFTLFIDGAVFATGSNFSSIPDEARTLIVGGISFDGYVDDVRFTKGMARYTGAFTPRQIASSFSISAIDPFAHAVVAQLHMDGGNGGTNFPDIKGKAVTRIGTTVVSTAKKRYGTASAFFSTKTDALSFPTSTDFDFQSDLTIEAWINPTDNSLSEWGIYDGRASNGINAPLVIGLRLISGVYRLYAFCGNAITVVGTTTSVPVGSWTHVAVVRIAGVFKLFVNGALDATTLSYTNAIVSGANPVIGHKDRAQAGYGTLGYIDEFRITKNVARYNASFKPVRLVQPNATQTALAYDPYASNVKALNRFDGTNAASVFTDETGRSVTRTGGTTAALSTAQKKFGVSSLKIGPNNFLDYPSSSDFNVGAGDYTAELWANFITLPTDGVNGDLFVFNGATKTFNPCFYVWGTGNLVVLRAAQTSGNIIALAHGMTTGVWYHMAFTRQGDTFTVFINGVIIGQATMAAGTIANEEKSLRIGGGALDAYIDDIRVTKGVARYVTAFTPPVAAFPALTNTMYAALFPSDPFLAQTVLHTNFNYGATSDSCGLTELVNLGVGTNRVAIDTGTFVENGAAYFNGQSYLQAVENSRFAFGTGNFTVEAWVNPTVRSSVSVIFGTNTTSGGNNISMYLNASGQVVVSTYAAGILTSTEAAPLNAWTHIAMQRNGTELSIWMNGVKVKTVVNSIDFTEAACRIGRNGATAQYYTGWIDQLRVTKAARFTDTFVPQVTL